jgi:tetratricopeptide (TPR) repeat protein
MDRELPIGTCEPWQAALELWDARLEPEGDRRAARAFEDLATQDATAFAWCARAWYYVADYAGSSRERIRLFERGARRGRRAVELNDSPGSLFWTAACIGGHADLQGTLKRAAQVPEILKYLRRLRDSEPDYYHGAVYRYLGQALVRQPGLAQRLIGAALPEFGPDVVMRRLQESIERDPPFVLTHQTLGQLAFAANGDRATAAEMFDRIDAMDLDATPNLAPENHRDAPRARELLGKIVRGRR